eukprot:GILJ01015508.1.p1 GENE.GILJ01015508.1~~GILJ01015508.1.p1  ORF type:complete len:198 (-),score=29.16 GILJ01015508.1:170-763(-)
MLQSLLTLLLWAAISTTACTSAQNVDAKDFPPMLSVSKHEDWTPIDVHDSNVQKAATFLVDFASDEDRGINYTVSAVRSAAHRNLTEPNPMEQFKLDLLALSNMQWKTNVSGIVSIREDGTMSAEDILVNGGPLVSSGQNWYLFVGFGLGLLTCVLVFVVFGLLIYGEYRKYRIAEETGKDVVEPEPDVYVSMTIVG